MVNSWLKQKIKEWLFSDGAKPIEIGGHSIVIKSDRIVFPDATEQTTKADMLKATYDPDADGKIALTELESAVCSETEADGKISDHAGISDAHHTPTPGFFSGAVEHMQRKPATGTAGTPQKLNDKDTGATNYVTFNAVDDDAQILLECPVYLSQYRIFEHNNANNTGNGQVKLQYLNNVNAWVDWKTGIVIGKTGDWKSWDTSPSRVLAGGLRVVCTQLDTGATTMVYIRELEAKD